MKFLLNLLVLFGFSSYFYKASTKVQSYASEDMGYQVAGSCENVGRTDACHGTAKS